MTIGIYAIYNKLDNKVYVGKSKNIERRISQHFSALRKEVIDTKRVNKHLFNSFKKYGEENFKWKILEEVKSCDEELLKYLELYYMDLHKSYDRDFGYNLRRDSSTNMIVHEETRVLISESVQGEKNPNYGNNWTDEQKSRMSEIKKKQFEDGTYDFMKTPEHKKRLSDFTTNLWKDEEKKYAMARKVAEAKSVLRFYQYCKITNEFIRAWESMDEIITHHPDYHKKSIYSVCSGWKKSYRGFVWKSEEKVAYLDVSC